MSIKITSPGESSSTSELSDFFKRLGRSEFDGSTRDFVGADCIG